MDLSSDLSLEILKFIDNTSHLASACLVNRIFHRYASPLLYKHIAIYSWMKDAKKRVVALFSTLSRRPNLAVFVRNLEICDCPKSFSESFLSEILNSLQHCINLHSCTWTRDGTITPQILETLSSRPNLRNLELNGHSDRRYDPHLLLRFTNLERISIIMPSSGVVNYLKNWVDLNQQSLRSLSLICKESTLITDDVLESLAPSLPNLEYLHISGCPRLTNHSVWALLFSNSEGLLSLGLEGLDVRIFDLSLSIEQLTREGKPHPLRRLQSITLSVPPLCFRRGLDRTTLPWDADPLCIAIAISSLLSECSLQKFHIYPTLSYLGVEHGFSSASEHLWDRLIENHAKTLKRVSICRIMVSWQALEMFCKSCTNLRELFVGVAPGFRRSSFSLSKTLRTIHINYPPSLPTAESVVIHTNPNEFLNPTEVLSILRRCSSTITQFGCQSEVWEVKRTFMRTDGSYKVQLSLKECDNPDVPEQFLVQWA